MSATASLMSSKFAADNRERGEVFWWSSGVVVGLRELNWREDDEDVVDGDEEEGFWN